MQGTFSKHIKLSMPLLRTDEVIVLDIKEIGESDLMISFLTRHSGKLKGIAKHAKKSIRRFPNCFSLGNLLSLEYSIRPNKDLSFLLQGRLIKSPMYEIHELKLDSNIKLGIYTLKLTDIALPLSLPEPNIYEMLLKLFTKLKEQRNAKSLCLYYETRLMKLLGYGINLTECLSCKRRYTFTGKAFFAPLKGGIYCQRCAPSTGTFTLEPAQITILNSYQTTDIEDMLITDLDPIAFERLSSVIVSHMKQHISPIPTYVWGIREKISKGS